MKKKLFIIPMLATMLLTACGATPNSQDTTTITTQGGTTEKIPGGNSSTTTTEKVPSTSSQTSSEDHKTSESNWATPSIPDVDPDKENLPCGQEYVSMPSNINNPIKLTDNAEPSSFLTDDNPMSDLPDNYSYIYGNNKTKGDFINANWNGGGLVLEYDDGKPLKGIQTPAWDAWTDATRTVEIKFTFHFFQPGNSQVDKTRNPFLFYGFDETGKLVYEKKVDNIKGITEGHKHPCKKELSLKLTHDDTNQNVRKVRYVELRLQNSPWDTNGKQVKPVISQIRIRRYSAK